VKGNILSIISFIASALNNLPILLFDCFSQPNTPIDPRNKTTNRVDVTATETSVSVMKKLNKMKRRKREIFEDDRLPYVLEVCNKELYY
jgi:hypothetical protein